MKINFIASFIVSLLGSYMALPLFIEMLGEANVTCENYRSQTIPTSLGLVFVFVQSLSLGILEVFSPSPGNISLIYLFAFVFIGLLGLFDDIIGNKIIKGLRGHIGALFRGQLTTGALKAVFGFFTSLVLSVHISNNRMDMLVNLFIISLFTNLINMFDLRPGRALKVFLFFALIFLLSGINRETNYILGSLLAVLIPYMFLDLKGKAMMGDVGSNVLGFSLGFYASINFNLGVRIIILSILVFFHILSEKKSISKIIANNKFLSYLDELGR